MALTVAIASFGLARSSLRMLTALHVFVFFFFFQAEDGIRDYKVTGVQTCALPICGLTRAVVEALRYGESLSDDVRAIYVDVDSASTEKIKLEWYMWGGRAHLVDRKSVV